MKTEAEQAQAMAELITNKDLLDDKGRLAGKVVFGADQLAVALVNAGYGDVSEYKAEIERLKAENKKYLDSIESVQAGRCRLRCPLTGQAVKEFAERLSVRALCLAPIETYHICNLIDELIKEVQNAEDKG